MDFTLAADVDEFALRVHAFVAGQVLLDSASQAHEMPLARKLSTLAPEFRSWE